MCTHAPHLLTRKRPHSHPHAHTHTHSRTHINTYAHTGQPPHLAEREVFLLQRKTTKVGDGLGKTTGWIHRLTLKNKGVNMLHGVEYKKVDDEGLHIQVKGQSRVLKVDNVILCAGQMPQRELEAALKDKVEVHLIGGAQEAAELDAKRAIKAGTLLATQL